MKAIEIKKAKEINAVGNYMLNGTEVRVSEITETGRIKGVIILNGEEINVSNSPAGLEYRIANNGKSRNYHTSNGTGTGLLEKQYTKLQKNLAAAILAMNDFQTKFGVTDAESAKRLDEKRKERKKARAKESRDEKLKRLIKKAKEYKQVERAMKLTDILLG